MSLIDRTKNMFGESLNEFTEYSFKWCSRNNIATCIELIAVLCVEVLFPSSAESGTISMLDEVLKCFDVDNAEDIKKAMPGADAGDVRVTRDGYHISLDMGQNIPKLLYYVAVFLRIAAKKYQRLQRPERAKKAAVTAGLYIQVCADLLKQRKETATVQVDNVLPILFFDRGPVPDIYNYHIDAMVESEYELTERNIERLGRKIKAQIAELSETGEGIK